MKNFTVLPNCPTYVDCAGTPYGNSTVDCNGNCGGGAKKGDLDNNLLQQTNDAQLYVSGDLNNTLTPSNCIDLNADEYGEGFNLPDGDKAPFQQMTFTLADEQAEQIKNAIQDIKETEEYKYAETMGNENSNGNALYLIIMQWAGQRK